MPVELFEDLKPEVFKSIIPGHPGHPCFRLSDSGHYGSFRTWGVNPLTLKIYYMPGTLGLAAFQADSIPYTQRHGCKPIDSRFL